MNDPLERSNLTQAEYFKDIVDTIREPLLVLDGDLCVLAANHSFYKFFKVKKKDTLGNQIYDLGNHQWDIPALRTLLDSILPDREVFNDYEVEHDFPFIGKRTLLLNARGIPAPPKTAQWILLAFEDVSERRRQEGLLQASEVRFREAFENATDNMLLVNKTTGRVLNSNRAAQQTFKYSKQKLLKMTLWDLAILKDQQHFEQIAKELENKGAVQMLNNTVHTRDGRQFPASIYLTDQAAVIQCNIRDISARKRSEEAMRESQMMLSHILDSIPQSIFWKNAAGVYLGCNEVFARTVGANSMEEVIGKTDFDLPWTRAEAEGYQADDREVVEKNLPKRHIIERAHTADGKTIWVDTTKSPLVDERGKPDGILGVYTDITESKRAEDALSESEKRFREVLENSLDASYKRDLKTNAYDYLSPVFAQITGYSAEEFASFPLETVLELMHPEDVPEVNRAIAESLYDPSRDEYWVDYRMKRKVDGDYRWLHDQYRVMRDAQGQPVALIGSVGDITERKRAEDQTVLKNKQLSVLFQLGQELIKLAPIPVTLERISNLISQVFDNQNLYIALYDEATKKITFPVYWMGGERKDVLVGRPLSNGLTEYVIHARAPVHIPDHVEQTLVEKGINQIGTSCQCYLGVPIMINERVIGVIAVQDYERANVYNAEQVELLATIASQAAVVIENARLFEQAQKEIAERQQAEEKFIKAFRVNPYVSTISRTEDGCLLEVNKAFETTLGYAREEAIGHSTLELGIWVNLAERERLLPILYSNGRLEKEEIQFITKGGQVLDCLYSGELIELDRVNYSLSIIEDITERKHAEQALLESEQRFRTLIEKAPVSISISRNGIVLFVNQKFLEMTGKQNLKEAIGKPVSEYFAPQFQEQSKERTRRRALGLPVPVAFESLFQRNDGVLIPIEATVAPVHLMDGDANMAFIFDISERKRAEEKLRESEERYKLMFESAPIAINITRGMNIIYANPTYLKLFGFSKLDELNKIQPLELFTPEVRPQILENIQRRAKGLPVPNSYETECFRKDGSRFPIIMNLTRTTFADGPATVGFIIDITERKRVEEQMKEYSEHLEEMVEVRTKELRQMQEDLVRKEKMAVLGTLAGGVGHELRNPLGVISNAIYYLEMVQPEADEKVKKYHTMIDQNVHNATHIVSDLLDYARVIKTDPQPGSVRALVEQALNSFPVPESIQVKIKIPAGLPQVYADPLHVEQVLGNLITNACQAMAGGGQLSVISDQWPERRELRAENREQAEKHEGKWVRIAVMDTGTGIAPENMQNLFEPLFSTKVTGIGLGLAVSQKLAEANGGRIEVQSKPGKGSTFTLVLPMVHSTLPEQGPRKKGIASGERTSPSQ